MIDIPQQIVSETQCARLYADFAHFVDSRNYEKLVLLFTEDGVFIRPGQVQRGRDEILQAMKARPENMVTHHVCTNIRVDIRNDGTAEGACSLLMFSRLNDSQVEPAMTVAQYRDVFALTDDGWRIRERVAELVFGK